MLLLEMASLIGSLTVTYIFTNITGKYPHKKEQKYICYMHFKNLPVDTLEQCCQPFVHSKYLFGPI